MAFKWVPFLEQAGAQLEAMNRDEAFAKAQKLYGDKVVRVQSVVSLNQARQDAKAVDKRQLVHRRVERCK